MRGPVVETVARDDAGPPRGEGAALDDCSDHAAGISHDGDVGPVDTKRPRVHYAALENDPKR